MFQLSTANPPLCWFFILDPVSTIFLCVFFFTCRPPKSALFFFIKRYLFDGLNFPPLRFQFFEVLYLDLCGLFRFLFPWSDFKA